MEQLDPIFLELGIIIATAAIFGIAARAFKQPPILGYILAGIILGPIGASLIQNQSDFKALSSFGIALLLFLVGLEVDWQKIKKLGNITGLLSILQIIGTLFLGFFVSLSLGLDINTAFIIGLVLAFSSTIVVIKLLSEKHDLDSLYGRISVGVLLAQDIVAIFVIALLAGSAQMKQFSVLDTVTLLAVKTIALVVFAWFVSSWIFPKIFKIFAKSNELLFVVSLAWCFTFAILTVKLGFSIEIGAFLAGVSLASLPYAIEIVGRIKSLRDFFIILFFVILGTELNLTGDKDWLLIIIFSLLAIIAKPIIVTLILSAQGLRRRVAFLTGLSLGQMSEFSMILSGLALTLNLIESDIASVITAATALSLLVSPYLINNSEKIFSFFKPILGFIERKAGKKYSLEIKGSPLVNHIIIFGYHRLGFHILKALRDLNHQVLIIDFNPDVIDKMNQLGIPAIFGDAQDEELLESIHLKNARMIISTIPHREESLFLIKKIRKIKNDIIIIVTAKNIEEALEFYKNGADYVILPEQISGEHMANLLKEYEKKTLRKFLTHKSEEVHLLKTKKQALYLE